MRHKYQFGFSYEMWNYNIKKLEDEKPLSEFAPIPNFDVATRVSIKHWARVVDYITRKKGEIDYPWLRRRTTVQFCGLCAYWNETKGMRAACTACMFGCLDDLSPYAAWNRVIKGRTGWADLLIVALKVLTYIKEHYREEHGLERVV